MEFKDGTTAGYEFDCITTDSEYGGAIRTLRLPASTLESFWAQIGKLNILEERVKVVGEPRPIVMATRTLGR
jgi:hypothetical protein